MNSREYPSLPLAGVGAIVVGGSGVLLVKRDKDPGEGSWSIPGGVIELGETQEDAVIREVHEESGIDVKVLGLLSTADLIIRDDEDRIRFHYILNHYLARALNENVSPEYPEAEVGWFSLSDLKSLDIAQRIRKLLKEHQSTIRDAHSQFF